MVGIYEHRKPASIAPQVSPEGELTSAGDKQHDV
jgi:hypothetical protein